MNSSSNLTLLTDPFLQLPTANSVRVVWFTEFAGVTHHVLYGINLENQVATTTTQLSRVREDQESRVGTQTEKGQVYQKPEWRSIWRHEAEVQNLTPGIRIPYQVVSVGEDGTAVHSRTFSLTPLPAPGTPLKILLTSDHQLKPMVAANLQKVWETFGVLDGIFFAGDLANVPDRASEWFDDNRGNAFFPCLQGRANSKLSRNGMETLYRGGELLQHSPLFTAIGNHEVMGRFAAESTGINIEFENAFPREVAKLHYPKESELPFSEWLKDNSFNTRTYEEIFTLPESLPGGKQYYAVTFGEIRLVVLWITNIWRWPGFDPGIKGKYWEGDPENPWNWGHGQFIFEPITPGSAQYLWLEQELNSAEFQNARFKIVMFHHPPHSLGGNVVPPYTDPVQVIEEDGEGRRTAVRYRYAKTADYIIRDVVPLLEAAGVQLVFYGHSHLWNRFTSPSGMHFLETSNVGNSYGAHLGDYQRPVPIANHPDYAAIGNPNGLEPIVPTIAPLLDTEGHPLPYLATNDLTAFTILDTVNGTVSSYYFDTRLT